MAAALHGRAAAAREVGLALVAADVAGDVDASFTVAFLHGDSVAAALLVPDVILAGALNAERSDARATTPPIEPRSELSRRRPPPETSNASTATVTASSCCTGSTWR